MKPITFKPVDVANQWFLVDVAIFHSKVLAFVGKRSDMARTVNEATARFRLPTAARVNKFVKDWVDNNGDMSDTNGDAFGFIGHVIIRVDKMVAGDLDNILVLNHECLHAANAILREIELWEGTNVEGLCYTHEYIFGELMRQILNNQGLTPIELKK